MRIDIITLFPEMCENVMCESVIGRARQNGAITICTHQLRKYSYDKHSRVDDCPYGGGKGMLIKVEPLENCFKDLCNIVGKKPYLIYMSPQGKVLNQNKIKELSKMENIAILCGHYEGIDERFIEEYVDEQISIGDYVLTGGELPALVLADALSRMAPGVLAEDICFEEESHYNGLLEYPQYTRPSEWNGRKVPEVLKSGHHANIEKWRKEQSIIRTAENRPDLIEALNLSEKDKEVLNKNTERREKV